MTTLLRNAFSAIMLIFFLRGLPISFSEERRVSPEPAETPKTGLIFTISLDHHAYNLSDKIILVTGEVKNLGPMSDGLDFGRPPRFRITQNGTLIEDGTTSRWLEMRAIRSILMAPGESEILKWNLKGYMGNEFDTPGKYTVQASLANPSHDEPLEVYWDPKRSLISNIVEFEILPPEGQKPQPGESIQPAGGSNEPPPSEQAAEKPSSAFPVWIFYIIGALAAAAIIAAFAIIRSRKRRSP